MSTSTGEPRPFVDPENGPRIGYVVGTCEHAVARQEWDAGMRSCERCPEDEHIKIN